mmetsp:Transcript_46294/g.77119  ORF Transcript_46294/g.77119 Transcript_46294/m.77119 type:complete len:245 (+) Transcript_46294:171-905(+)
MIVAKDKEEKRKRKREGKGGESSIIPAIILVLLFLLLVLFELELLHLVVEAVHDDLLGDLGGLGLGLGGKAVLGGTLDLGSERKTVHGLGLHVLQDGRLGLTSKPLVCGEGGHSTARRRVQIILEKLSSSTRDGEDDGLDGVGGELDDLEEFDLGDVEDSLGEGKDADSRDRGLVLAEEVSVGGLIDELVIGDRAVSLAGDVEDLVVFVVEGREGTRGSVAGDGVEGLSKVLGVPDAELTLRRL